MNDTAAAAPQRSATPLHTPASNHVGPAIPGASAPVLLSPAVAHATAATVGELLNAFGKSAEPELLKVYHAYAPWFVQLALPDPVIDSGIQYAVAMVENATQGAILSLPTAQDVIGHALAFLDKHIPQGVKPFLGPMEDVVVAKLQQLGLLPAGFSRAALREAA